ncbi:hypothetical protein THTE_1937 [Thermogutta terrifontis]|uniref:Uncharacterized protein n=1 Tax=Thermogutta terrifontis TaxID=1331910 RepID=A0A286REZ3_9BACT|nr:hypothetical protein THTE_1937 [Thermogutta terrifontis]
MSRAHCAVRAIMNCPYRLTDWTEELKPRWCGFSKRGKRT